MPLPTNIAGSYPDRGPGDLAHQEHHDAVHAAVNEVNEGRLTEAALSATIDRRGETVTALGEPAAFPPATLRAGVVLAKGAAGETDAGKIESPFVFLTPDGGLTMTYSGYNTTDSAAVGRIHYATSADGLTWTKRGVLLGASGEAGAPDEHGVTGGTVVIDPDDGTFHLFYIGLDQPGYEQGTKRICHATAETLAGPWTRHGVMVAPEGTGWRQAAVWKPNLVRRRGQWFMFFNASGNDSRERIGYATATNLHGPWTVDDANSPVKDFDVADDKIMGDPFVWREGNHWRMDYFRATSTYATPGDYYAITTDEQFPLGWVNQGQTTYTSLDQGFKPSLVYWRGRLWHYASTGGTIIANYSLPGTGERVTYFGKSASLADYLPSTHQIAALGNPTGNVDFVAGQDKTHMVFLSWKYNASASAAFANIETYGGANEIRIQNNSGGLRLGGTGGKVGFYGNAPATKPTVSGSRTDGTALASLISALAALGLITDSTTA